MEKLYQDYQDIAAFYLVYISEAHALDDRHPVGYAKELGIKEHTSYGERCTVAGRLMKDKKLTIPCLVDNMDGAVEKAYKAWPDRIYLVRTDGKFGVAGKRGPWGFRPALKEAQAWLAEYREKGQEPALGDSPGQTVNEESAEGKEKGDEPRKDSGSRVRAGQQQGAPGHGSAD
jgi:hypothetical protein